MLINTVCICIQLITHSKIDQILLHSRYSFSRHRKRLTDHETYHGWPVSIMSSFLIIYLIKITDRFRFLSHLNIFMKYLHIPLILKFPFTVRRQVPIPRDRLKIDERWFFKMYCVWKKWEYNPSYLDVVFTKLI